MGVDGGVGDKRSPSDDATVITSGKPERAAQEMAG